MCYGENMPLDVLFVRDDDIPGSGAGGRLRSRIGRIERGRGEAPELRGARHRAAVRDGADARFRPLQALHRGARRFRLPRRRTRSPASASPPPTRTSSGAFSPSAAIRAEVVVLSGSVEIAPRLGRADLICDLVSTGSTLAANHLRQAEVVLESQAVLIRTPVPIPLEKQDWTRRLFMRIDGVEQVKGSKYIMLHASRSALPAIAKLLPGQRSADGHSARGTRRPGRRACRMPRKRVLGNARAAEGRGRELRAGACRSRRCWPEGIGRSCASSNGNPCLRPSAGARWSGPRSATPRASPRGRVPSSMRCARGGDAALSELTLRFDGAQVVRACGIERGVRAGGAQPRPAPSTRRSTARSRRSANFMPRRRPRRCGSKRRRAWCASASAYRCAPSGFTSRRAPRPLPSTAIMLAVPAAIAGCPLRIMCTAPRPDGGADPCGSRGRAQSGRRAGLQGGRRASHRRHGLRHRVDPEVRQVVRPRQCLGDGRQNARRQRSRGRRGRFAGRRHRGHGDRR